MASLNLFILQLVERVLRALHGISELPEPRIQRLVLRHDHRTLLDSSQDCLDLWKGMLQPHDDLSWRWTSSGKFSVRTAAEFLMFDGINNCNLPFLWNLKIPLRVKIFLWLADRNKLLTADNLRKRGWHGPTICNLCYSDAESVEHILHHYFYAVSVWNWLTDRLNLNLAGRNNTTDGLAT
ncbi:putative ribonuclease H protein [Ananas comosus]|uniref:Putative ribonuclease H protein n=1 Tax=Ananas comosus TaxID=4615 RepID=A0A199VFP1_ANACO|nr:putative ribonuclease H protein [Ananas comosus]